MKYLITLQEICKNVVLSSEAHDSLCDLLSRAEANKNKNSVKEGYVTKDELIKTFCSVTDVWFSTHQKRINKREEFIEVISSVVSRHEATQVVVKPKSDIPVLSEEQAKAIMTKVIRLASKNIVKCFIPKRMAESVIMEELFGQNLVSKPLEQYSKEDFAVGKAAAAQILQVGLTPYKSGFLIKPVCMAGAYKNSLIKYQSRNLTYYILSTKDKTILNTRTGEVVDATFKNCSYLNNAHLIDIVAAS